MLSIVPDIQGELAGGIDEYLKGLKEPEPEPEPAVGRLGSVRGFILYHYMPFNHGIGWLLTDPMWLFCKLLTVVPLAGTEFVVYFVIFCLMQRRDEYQLVRFILEAKGLLVTTRYSRSRRLPSHLSRPPICQF